MAWFRRMSAVSSAGVDHDVVVDIIRKPALCSTARDGGSRPIQVAAVRPVGETPPTAPPPLPLPPPLLPPGPTGGCSPQSVPLSLCR